MSENRISGWNVLIGFWAVLLLFLLTPLGIPVKMLFERNPEKVALSGVPIAQAISDYRSDHGLFPLKLADLVPAYLSEIPKGWGWRFGGNDLIKYADQPHSLISFNFIGQHSNQWRFQGDSGLDHRQLNLPGPIVKASVLTGQALITAQVAEYESRIKRNPGDMSFYSDKINCLHQAGLEAKLGEDCNRAAAIFPDWWWPQMILASLKQSNAQAVAKFEAWVRAHGSFENFCYLAQCHRDKSDKAMAISVLKQAVEQPTDYQTLGVEWEGRQFIFDVCKFAYDCGEIELTLRLTDIWQAQRLRAGGDGWQMFRAAAELRLGQFEAAVRSSHRAAQLLGRSPDVDRLIEAATAHDTNFVFEATNPGPSWKLFNEPRP